MKTLLSTLLVLGASSSIAMTTIDFNSAFYKTSDYFRCNGVKITQQSTVNDLVMNCTTPKVIMHTEPTTTNSAALSHNPNGGSSALTYIPDDDTPDTVLDKVKFKDDKNSYVICYFKDSILVKCKYKQAKALPQKKVAASTPVVASAPIKNSSSAAH